MNMKEINKLERIMQDIRDFRDETYCAYSDWQSKGEPDTNENIECTCGIYDEALDKLEEAKNECPSPGILGSLQSEPDSTSG